MANDKTKENARRNRFTLVALALAGPVLLILRIRRWRVVLATLVTTAPFLLSLHAASAAMAMAGCHLVVGADEFELGEDDDDARRGGR